MVCSKTLGAAGTATVLTCSTDVEGYLKEKGIHLDSSSSVVEVEVPIHPATPESSSTLSSVSVPDTPPPSTMTNAGLSLDFDDLALSNVGYSDADTGSFLNFVHPTSTHQNMLSQVRPHWNGQGATATADDAMGWQDPFDFDTALSGTRQDFHRPSQRRLIDVDRFIRSKLTHSMFSRSLLTL